MPDPQALRAALAPTGTLRATINLGNPLLARREADGGEVRGVSVDLANDLARRLALPLELVVVEAAGKAVEAVAGGRAEVGFFAVDPARGAGIAFTAPYLLIEGAYMVREASPIAANEEVDRPGRQVVVGQASAYDLFLTRHLRQASLVRAAGWAAVIEAFATRPEIEVIAGIRQQLLADAARLPGHRVLPGRFMVIEQAMGCAKSCGEAAAAFLAGFVESAKAEGRVAAAVARHAVEGAIVAPPAAPGGR